jgi:hypothetical protein
MSHEEHAEAAWRILASLPEADRDPVADECLCVPFWYYQSLRDQGLIAYPTRHGVTSLLRYQRARAALKNRKRRASHRRQGGLLVAGQYLTGETESVSRCS